jgi:hypothetical protein
MTDAAEFLAAHLDKLEAQESRKRTWTKDYFGAPCPGCGHRMEGVGLTGTRVDPCRCDLTREQYDELVGAKPSPSQEVLRHDAARKILAEYQGAQEFYAEHKQADAGEVTGLWFAVTALAQACGWEEGT